MSKYFMNDSKLQEIEQFDLFEGTGQAG